MIEKVVRPCIKNCRAYVPGKPVEEVQRELGIARVYKLASNENPLGTSPLALKAMAAELTKSNRYPESLCVDLVKKLAAFHNVTPRQIMAANGLDDVITIIGMAFIDPDTEVVYADHTFPAYGDIVRKMGGIPVEVPMTTNLEHDLDAMARAVTSRTKLVFVCNPNNPTGTIRSKAALEDFLTKIPEDVVAVFDEAYHHYAHSEAYGSMMDFAARKENVIVLRTFSKVFGLGGLRTGYAVSHENTINMLLKLRQPFPVNRIAQAGAIAALDDEDFIRETIRVNAEGLKQYQKAFDGMGLRYYDSHANFIYVETGRDSKVLFNKMLHDGIIVRPQNVGSYPSALRITIGTKEENELAIASLKKRLGEMK